MGIGKYCSNCGYVFRGQRTGKCPDCGYSAYQEKDRFYSLSPQAIRQFNDFYKNGGDIESLRLHNKNIAIVEKSPKEDWVILSIYGDIIVTFADYGKGPEVIASLPNRDGFGIKDIPSGLLAEASQMADKIIHSY